MFSDTNNNFLMSAVPYHRRPALTNNEITKIIERLLIVYCLGHSSAVLGPVVLL